MKVGVFVGASAATPEVGGGFTIVNEILAGLSARGKSRHEFVILTISEDLKHAPAFRGMKVVSLAGEYWARPLPARVLRKVQSLVGPYFQGVASYDDPTRVRPLVDQVLTREGIEVIWYPSAGDTCTLDIPYIIPVWDLQHRLQPFFPEVSEDGGWAYRERWLSTTLRRAAVVLTGTEVGRAEIERFYGVPRERIRVAPFPTPTFAEAELASSAPPAVSGQYLFYPAQFWPHKNHANLLQALRLLRERDQLDLSLVFTGSDKGNEPFIRELVSRLNLTDRVHFLGFVPRETLASLYRHAFALTFLTFFGPDNLPPLEALAAGCPVIASDVTGAREQLGDAALLVDPRSPEQIADAVLALHRDPARRAGLIQRGKDRASNLSARGYVDTVVTWLDEFEPVRRCWPPGVNRLSR
jgi:glycosyltransferase involved in cell wall biosynthesis